MFPLQAVEAAVTTNSNITIYSDNTGVTSPAMKVNNQIRVQLSGTVKATRHAKYIEEGWRNPVKTEGTRTDGRITSYAYKCPGYYITRLYSDTNATKLIGSIVAYVSTAQLNNPGCEAIKAPAPEKPATPPATIQPSYPDPTAETEKIQPKVTTPKVNPVYVEPTQPAPAPTITNPVVKEIEPDVCGRTEGVSTADKDTYRGMYPVGGASYDNGRIKNLYYVPCEDAKIDSKDLMYVTSNGPMDCTTETTVIDEINKNGTKSGNNVDGYVTYSKTENIPTYKNGVSTRDIGNGCAIQYDESKLKENEDLYGNSKYICESPATLENGACVDKSDLLEDVFNDCPKDLETCMNEFGSDNDINGDDPLPSCYCPTLGKSNFDAGYTCCLFECPGFEAMASDFKQYLGEDLIGEMEVPELPKVPEVPEIPNIFDVLNGVENNNKPLEPITTEEDPGLETSTFDKSDIESQAEEIEFREDESGGFDIANPVESLDENLKNPPKVPVENQDYPTYSDKKTTNSNKAVYPGYKGESVEQPSYSDKATIPSYSDKAKVPTDYGG